MRWKTHGWILALPALGGCVEQPISPHIETAISALLSINRLEVGETAVVSGGATGAIRVAGGSDGGEYLLVPFNASETTQSMAVEIEGTDVQPPENLRGQSLHQSPFAFAGQPGLQPDHDFHIALRERERRELAPMFARVSREDLTFSRATAPAVPAPGDILTLNASLTACSNPVLKQARVAVVSDRAIIVEDLSNPPGGLTDAEYQHVADVFDTLIHPVNTENFGETADIDNNERVIIFYTRAVNELTPPGSEGVTLGFFFGRDLLPVSDCATSNVAEMFYMLTPDPTGSINNNPRSREMVLRVTLGTVGHEFQHLINASRRIYVNQAFVAEEVWLNEGLSHIAEELLFYEVSGLQPRQNITLETLRSSQRILDAVNTYMVGNLALFIRYLLDPDQQSLMGIVDLPTRGASWAFLRYAADHDPGDDQPLWFGLVNSTEAGVSNLDGVLDGNPIDVMQTWTASVYTDDFVDVVGSALFQQPSWNFRSVLPALREDEQFPLKVRALTDTELTLALQGGGASFVRFGIPAGNVGTLLVTSGGEVPPVRLRVTLIRLR